jgi:hypothetical protein
MITINGKSYPMWSQFVEKKEQWIGGTLEEFGDGICDGGVTTITDITLELKPEWGNAVVFSIIGKDFSEEFNVQGAAGVSGGSEPGWIEFYCYGTRFRIKGKDSKQEDAV